MQEAKSRFKLQIIRATRTCTETMVAYELGLRTKLFDDLNIGANIFWNDLGDITYLEPGLGPPGLLNLKIDNVADAFLFGVEVDFDYKLAENVNAFLSAIQKARPSGAKGTFIKRITMSSTMGPGVKIDTAEVSA